MNRLWSFIDQKDWQIDKKYRFAFFAMAAICGIAGFILWLIISIWTLSGPDWMLCFTGYPVLISFFVVFIYSCSHAFHKQDSVK